MRHNTRSDSKHHSTQGTVLLTITIIVFMIAAAAAVTMKLALSDLEQNRQQHRMVQSRQVAESAAHIGVAQLNNGLLEKHERGTLGNKNGKLDSLTLTSSDVHNSMESISIPTGSIGAKKANDGFDNDGDGQVDESDEANEIYTGGKYRIEIKEWSKDNKIDDDNDGITDELDEDPTRVSSTPIDFKIKGDWIIPQDPFIVKNLRVLGAVPDTDNPGPMTDPNDDPVEYHAPVTAKVLVEKKDGSVETFEPWGDFNKPNSNANIHNHGGKYGKKPPAKSITPKDEDYFEAGTPISIVARSWSRDFVWDFSNWAWTWGLTPYKTRKPENPSTYGTPNLEPRKDGDPIPGFEGADNQQDPADFMGSLIDDGKMNLNGYNAVIMSELTHEATKDKKTDTISNADENGVDFQDLVTKFEFATKASSANSTHKRRFTMDVTGTYGGYTTTLGTVVTATPKTKGKYGVFATNDLTLREKSVVDSYNPNQGSYEDQKTGNVPTGSGLKYARSNGNVGANKNVGLNSHSAVMGKVDYGVSLFNPPSTYSASTSKLDEDQIFEEKTFPAKQNVFKGSKTFPAGDSTIDGQNFQGRKYSDITLKSGARVTTTEKTFLWITGSFEAEDNSELIVKGPAQIRIDQDFIADSKFKFQAITKSGPVVVYVGEKFELGPESQVYSTDAIDEKQTPHTENLRWYVGNSDSASTTSVRIESDMQNQNIDNPPIFQGILYAPKADVEIKPETQMLGTVIGQNVDIWPYAGVHYDESLDKFCDILWANCEYTANVESTWVKSTGRESTSD